jgi:hypothetical protein
MEFYYFTKKNTVCGKWEGDERINIIDTILREDCSFYLFIFLSFYWKSVGGFTHFRIFAIAL